jgi:copper homeostasis protein (lipoprotein)
MKKHILKHRSLQVTSLIVILFFVQCTHITQKTNTGSTSIFDKHNSANSLDWNGTYKGTMPCADCEGIETVITLTKELKYIIRSNYLGKKGNILIEKGGFTWNNAGNTISLSGIKDKPNQYFIGENRIQQLDMLGNKIAINATNNYFLTKQMYAPNPVTPKLSGHWELNYIANTLVSFQELYPNKKPTIRFDTINNAISGHTSCNNFGGKLNVDGNKIDFKGPFAMTKMMCLDGKGNGENMFVETLQKVNTYSINNDTILNFITGDVAVMQFMKK